MGWRLGVVMIAHAKVRDHRGVAGVSECKLVTTPSVRL